MKLNNKQKLLLSSAATISLAYWCSLGFFDKNDLVINIIPILAVIPFCSFTFSKKVLLAQGKLWFLILQAVVVTNLMCSIRAYLIAAGCKSYGYVILVYFVLLIPYSYFFHVLIKRLNRI